MNTLSFLNAQINMCRHNDEKIMMKKGLKDAVQNFEKAYQNISEHYILLETFETVYQITLNNDDLVAFETAKLYLNDLIAAENNAREHLKNIKNAIQYICDL